jgi:hypothetical protein
VIGNNFFLTHRLEASKMMPHHITDNGGSLRDGRPPPCWQEGTRARSNSCVAHRYRTFDCNGCRYPYDDSLRLPLLVLNLKHSRRFMGRSLQP